MSYKIAKSQAGVMPGHKRYRFDVRVNGSRVRKQVTCQPGMVTQMYLRWEREQFQDAEDGSAVTMGEMIDELILLRGSFCPTSSPQAPTSTPLKRP